MPCYIRHISHRRAALVAGCLGIAGSRLLSFISMAVVVAGEGAPQVVQRSPIGVTLQKVMVRYI